MLPGAVGVAEVDRDACGDREGELLGHFQAFVPGQGPPEVLGKPGDGGDQSGVDGLGFGIGDLGQHHVTGGALDQGGDMALAVLADDQVPFPVARHGPGTKRASKIVSCDMPPSVAPVAATELKTRAICCGDHSRSESLAPRGSGYDPSLADLARATSAQGFTSPKAR